MKLRITYDEADLRRLILRDLVRQGIPATDSDITLKKGVATIAVEVSGDDSAPEPTVPSSRPSDPPTVRESEPPVVLPPKLETVEGGANPVDMSDVLGASKSLARKDGPFAKHSYLPGESSEYPGGNS